MLLLCIHSTAPAQAPQFKFLHLAVADGLPDGTVRGITQDKYGYTWIGTQYGVCRYDGARFTVFLHKNDSISLPGNFTWSLFTDKAGDVWVGTDRFISRYDYGTGKFFSYACPFNAAVTKIREDEQGMLWLASSGGLLRFDKQNKQFKKYRSDADSSLKKSLGVRINDLFLDTSKGMLYLATHAGFRMLDYRHDKLQPLIIDGRNDPHAVNSAIMSTVTGDKNGNIWFGCGFINSVVVRWNPVTRQLKYYPDFTSKVRGWTENRALAMFTDQQGRVWAGGAISSLSLYLPEEDSFYHYQHDALLPSSIAGNAVISFYQDQSGMIWAGTEGYGVDRFHPDNILFTSFQPRAAEQPSLLHDWGRAAMEDTRGNLWFGTSKGISVYNPANRRYTNYFNDAKNPSLLSFNTIRSFAEDKQGFVWVGTGNGLNRFDPVSGRFRIYNETDSLKAGFVWSLLISSGNELYVGGTGGLQRFDKAKDRLTNVSEDPAINNSLRGNIRNIFEDRKQGIWLGVYDGGLIYYQPGTGKIERFRHNNKDTHSLCNNFVSAVAEDNNGIVWIATRDGLDSFDPATRQFRHFTTGNGLPSNKTAAVRVDEANRIWVATGAGLSVLGEERCSFRNFSTSDGLPTNEFNDQVASTTRDGRFIYPTYRGFVVFKPEMVQQKTVVPTPVYASAFKVFNQSYLTGTNPEEVKELRLKHNQNFFSIELAGLNFEHPDKIVYAYKLVPFDKDWIYTKERTVTYTNVSGGNYTFQYKATTDQSNWHIPVRTLSIRVGTIFYKTAWFAALVFVLLASMIYSVYNYRIRQTRKVHRLQLQATRLEKDKTEIQYQHLINQFNPHFLFNSLTSLNSLIYENKELASSFLEQLSKVYRYLLMHKETQLVSLQVESDFVKNYIALLQTRFEKGIEVEIDIPTAYRQKRIVPVTFQLFIENAIKHNIVDAATPLVIRFRAEKDYLFVSNNLQRKGYVEASNRKGLVSLQVLYTYLSSNPLIYEEDEHSFLIKVPLID